MTLQLLGLISGVLGVTGVVLNNRKLIACFGVWMVSNAISAGLHVYAGLWTLAGRDLVFFVLAIDGWRRWRGTGLTAMTSDERRATSDARAVCRRAVSRKRRPELDGQPRRARRTRRKGNDDGMDLD